MRAGLGGYSDKTVLWTHVLCPQTMPPLFKNSSMDFPGGPVVKTPHFHCRGTGSIPGLGISACRVVWPKKEN